MEKVLNCSPITRREALILLKTGESIICRIREKGEYLEVNSQEEMVKAVELEQKKIYDELQFYKKDDN